MKVKRHKLIDKNNLWKFTAEHVGETFMIHKVTAEYVDFEQEIEQTEAEMHMQSLHNILEYVDLFTEEEKAAIKYAIECIKTLDDTGIIKENNNDD